MERKNGETEEMVMLDVDADYHEISSTEDRPRDSCYGQGNYCTASF